MKKRGVGKKMLIKSGKMKKFIDWREFISNDENKMQLIEIMLKVQSKDSFASHLQCQNITLIVIGTYQLTSNDGINTIIRKNTTMSSSQEETDTRIIKYY